MAFGLTACGGCNEKEAERHRHEYIRVVTEPTCTAKGYSTYTCECGSKYVTDYTDPIGHEYVGDVCSRCGWIRHDHIYTKTEVAATCTEGGYTRGVCDICGATYTVNREPLGHNYDNGKCKRCDYFDPDKHGHEYEQNTVAPDCTHQGYTVYTCWCGESYKSNYTSPRHSLENGKCTECGYFDISGHKHEYEIKISEPDCINGGYTSFVCWCGESYEEGYINPLGHDFVDGQCSRCKALKPTDGLEYIISDDGEYYICTGIGSATERAIIIASDFNGIPVTEIAESAFSEERFLKSIIIPDSITSIGDCAFLRCEWLASITIPESVTVMGMGVFSFCYGITIYCEAESKPNGWDKWWNNKWPVVWGCKNNNTGDDGSIYIEADRIRYSLKDGNATVLKQLKSTSGDINIPQSVTYKGIAYKVTTIADNAFEDCYDLTSIIIPYGVTAIGDSAFKDCRRLDIAEVPDSVTYIGSYAFAFCGRLAAINIPNGIVRILEGTYRNCSSVTNITIPDSVNQIDKMAFHCIEGLTSVIIPDSVVTIGYNSFGYCKNLQSITIGSGVKEIGDNMIDYYDNLTDIYYNGTKDEWNAIAKGESWDGSLTRYTIHCTDGDIKYIAEE